MRQIENEKEEQIIYFLLNSNLIKLSVNPTENERRINVDSTMWKKENGSRLNEVSIKRNNFPV